MRSVFSFVLVFWWLSLLPVGASCSNRQYTIASDSLHVVLNYAIVIEYCSSSISQGWFIPLDMFDPSLAARCSQSDSTIHQLLQNLGFAQDDLNQLLMQDPEYNKSVSHADNLIESERRLQYHWLEKQKAEAVEHLSKTNSDYIKLKNICIKLQSAINRASLQFAANEYLIQKRVFPTNWIPPAHLQFVLKKKSVRKINRQYQRAELKFL